MRPTRLSGLLLLAAALLFVGGLTPVAIRAVDGAVDADGSTQRPIGPRASRLQASIDAAQTRLREVPRDWNTWARLGSAYIEQARITIDPSFYPKAEAALRRSLELSPETNWAAMAGMAALANARHDFPAALDWGRRAERINPAAGAVHGVIADALTQLGDYPGARVAVQRMLDVQPGVASFTRASYHFEQHGQVAAARTALERAVGDSTDPADIAFCRYYLAELAFTNGDPATALTEFDAGLAADPGYHLLRGGRAKVYLALGRTEEALREYERVVQRLPLPHLVAEFGDALTATGQPARARQQYDLWAAQQRILTDGGVTDRLASAVHLADHGKPAEALVEARAEWAARQSVLVADALAWALHRNGQDAEALGYATIATALGWRNATFLYHRGVIRHALGDVDSARSDLADALAINPHFDVLQAPAARQLLASLGGPR